MDFRSLPKVELHLHLDCALSVDVVTRLDPSVTPARYAAEFVAPAHCRSLAEWLTCPPRSVALMQTDAGLRAVVGDLFRQLLDDNVIYAEIRFAPLLHCTQGLSPSAVVDIVEQATADASRRTGVAARLILCTLRHFSYDQSMATVGLVRQFRGTTVVAFDIAGDEAGFSLDNHEGAFGVAHTERLHCTAHAGEAAGHTSVRETLDRLRPTRVGHGVHSIENAALVDRLIRDRIHLEICPTCNLQTNVVPDYAEHPVDRLFRAGVSLGLNTDARAVSDITLGREYEKMSRTFGWREEDFHACNRNALTAAFIDDNLRTTLLGRLADGYAAAGAGIRAAR